MLVAFYDRVSTLQETQDTSIENQNTLFRMKVEKEGWRVYKVYKDRKSAKDLNRPGYQQLMKDAEKRRFDCVVVKSISRWSRNATQGVNEIRKLMDLGIRFITLDGQFDSERDKQEMMLSIYMALAQNESEQMSERIKYARRAKANRGEFLGSIPPYGYKKISKKEIVPDVEKPIDENGKQIIIESESVKTVLYIFGQFLQGKSTPRIAKELNEKGILPPYAHQGKKNAGKQWHDTSVLYVLKNRVYIGELVQLRDETKGFIRQGRKVNEPKDQVIVTDACEPLISREDFNKVQEILAERSKRVNRGKKNLFAGIAKCADCGQGMHFKKDRGYYICGGSERKGKEFCWNHKITQETLITLVSNDLRELMENNDKIEKVVNEIKANTKKELPLLHSKLEIVEKELVMARKREKELSFAYLDGVFDKEQFERLRDDLAERILDLENQKIELIRKINEQDDIKERYEKLKERVKIYANFEVLNEEILLNLVESIEVKDEHNIVIHYKFLEK